MPTEPLPDGSDISTTTTSPPRAIHWPRGFPHPMQRLIWFFRILGPGLSTGASDDDPSGIGTYSQAGAAFGIGQLWLALYMLPTAIAVQEMCGRVGLVTATASSRISSGSRQLWRWASQPSSRSWRSGGIEGCEPHVGIVALQVSKCHGGFPLFSVSLMLIFLADLNVSKNPQS